MGTVRFVTKEWFNSGIGMPEGFSSGGGTIDAQQTGAASVGIQNNSSNNFFGYLVIGIMVQIIQE